MLDVIINLSPIYKLEDLLKNTLRHHPASGDHDLNNLEFPFPLGYCNTNFSFSGKTVFKEFSIYTVYFYVKVQYPIVAPYLPPDDLYKSVSTIPEYASTQVTSFLFNWFSRRKFFRFLSIYSYVKIRPSSIMISLNLRGS